MRETMDHRRTGQSRWDASEDTHTRDESMALELAEDWGESGGENPSGFFLKLQRGELLVS